jgi:hypothetical protein
MNFHSAKVKQPNRSRFTFMRQQIASFTDCGFLKANNGAFSAMILAVLTSISADKRIAHPFSVASRAVETP